jgi:hypothetical protein
VHLSDGGRCQGFGVQLGKGDLMGAIELGFDGLDKRFEAERRDLVLQLCKLVDKLHRHQVRAGGQHLAQLDVGGAQLLQGHAHPFSARELLQPLAALAGDHLQPDLDVLFDFQGFDQVAEPVFEQHRQNLAVTVQVAVGAANDTDLSDADHDAPAWRRTRCLMIWAQRAALIRLHGETVAGSRAGPTLFSRSGR